MLHNLLATYLDLVENAIESLRDAYVERYQEEILTPIRLNLKIRVRFSTGNLLEISEAIVIENNSLMWLDYRYHYQDDQNKLIFRYDSTPHFPNLPSFPHHKHLPKEVIACQKPAIWEVVQEVSSRIRNASTPNQE
ncbi:MAG: toxin TumE [Prochlorotrichaceae cyanobacterium]